MKRRVEGQVASVTSDRPGAQEVVVRVPHARNGVLPVSPAAVLTEENGCSESTLHPALNFVALTGRVDVGDRVLLNTVAMELRLGTGGMDFVIAAPERAIAESPAPGHILKVRYTPVQTPVLAVEAPESPHHQAILNFTSLDELPIVCAELHSQVPAICAGARWALEEHGFGRRARIVYIMTDTAALPLALSRLVPEMKALGLIDTTITAGQAFGGDYEAVNLYTALAAAKDVAGADLVVVCQGPGNVGTQTPLGFSGVDQGLAINAAASLDGIPIAVARISFADRRDRHHGLSHHTITVLRQIARAPAFLALPRLPEPQRKLINQAIDSSGISEMHQPVTVDADRGLNALIETGLDVTTMGRTVEQERPFFLAAAAAGLLASQLVEARACE